MSSDLWRRRRCNGAVDDRRSIRIQRHHSAHPGRGDRSASNAGAGLLESIYTPCLHAELTARQLRFVTQRAVPIVYKGMPLESSYRVDLIVEDLVVVELKSTSALLPVHQAQVLTYLEITKCPAGLLINFNVPRLMDGVKRLINPRAPEGVAKPTW
jgi:GxxExxY protein